MFTSFRDFICSTMRKISDYTLSSTFNTIKGRDPFLKIISTCECVTYLAFMGIIPLEPTPTGI